MLIDFKAQTLFLQVKKVKSIQIFREPQKTARAGDRAALCVTQFDAAKVERGLLAAPGVLKPVDHVVVRIDRVKASGWCFFADLIP